MLYSAKRFSSMIYILSVSVMLVVTAGHGFPALARPATLPITIDYPMLRSLAVQNAFTESGESATVLEESGGCRKIVISEPHYSGEPPFIRFEVKVDALLGMEFGDNCLMPMSWKGYLVFLQKPHFAPNSWKLSFKTTSSRIYDSRHRPAVIAGKVWDLIKTRVYGHMDGIIIDLGEPVRELRSFLQSLIIEETQVPAEKMLNSLRPQGIKANADAVRINLLMDVDERIDAGKAPPKEVLSDAELKQLAANWETWDAFLVNTLETLSQNQLSDDDRQILLDTLLETRHAFISGFSGSSLQSDFVRTQFCTAWKQLSPVFRRHLAGTPSPSLLGYLAFFTASDALVTLDRIGWQLGIEISRNGLIRLARLIGRDQAPLNYSPKIDRRLREVLGLGPPLEVPGPNYDGESLDLEPSDSSEHDGRNIADLIKRTGRIFISPALAATSENAGDLNEIRRWLNNRSKADIYLKRIKALLQDAAQQTLEKRASSQRYRNAFIPLLLATGWQESCLRQFVVKKRKLVYLRSYNGSSVGLMQINERVWRGIYDLNQLRWNIGYNARAGCEVLDLYVAKYIHGKSENRRVAEELKEDAFASLVYAMYNGGPSEFKKFLTRRKNNKFYDSDTLFLEKYGWVENGRWENYKMCIGGT